MFCHPIHLNFEFCPGFLICPKIPPGLACARKALSALPSPSPSPPPPPPPPPPPREHAFSLEMKRRTLRRRTSLKKKKEKKQICLRDTCYRLFKDRNSFDEQNNKVLCIRMYSAPRAVPPIIVARS